jgi:hypothetical protein
MKSTKEDLMKRGYLTTEVSNTNILKTELLEMLHNPKAIQRSKAIKLLALETLTKEDIQLLVQYLKKEKALYTKIYLCELLSSLGVRATVELIPYLGKINNNQYTEIPPKSSKKKSNPLARDIVARTLANASIDSLSILLEVLNSKDSIKISEVLDAIGYMLFYHPQAVTKEIVGMLYQTYENYKDNLIIVWKLTTWLSAFTKEQSERLLNRIEKEQTHPTIHSEIERTKWLQLSL